MLKKYKHIFFDIDKPLTPNDKHYTLIYNNYASPKKHCRVWYDVRYKEEAFVFWFANMKNIINSNLKDYYDTETNY